MCLQAGREAPDEVSKQSYRYNWVGKTSERLLVGITEGERFQGSYKSK